jgi:putative ABC transport system permease protein
MAALFEGVGIALSSLRSNKMRASLTILGVAIAVGVVIVISALIAGFNKGISDMLASLGPKTFWVGRYWGGQGDVDPEDPNPWRHRPPLTVAEADRLERLPTIAFVVYDEGTSANIEFEGRRLAAVQVRGRDADWPMIEGGRISPGRSYSHFEDAANAHVVVVNTKLAEQLFGQREALDRRIKIGGMPYQVIGVYDPPPRLFEGGDRPEVFVPHGTMIKDLPYFKGWMDMFVVPEDSVTVEQAIDDVTIALREMRGLRPGQKNNFDAITQQVYVQAVNSFTIVARVLMFALSAVGLIVGGIGVVAIMMISVTERTREIGVRKALGATRREILWQFLVEATTLTLVGGITGMIFGWSVALLLKVLTAIPMYVPLIWVVVALSVAGFAGLVFGVFPATKAARLDPVEALRYE